MHWEDLVQFMAQNKSYYYGRSLLILEIVKTIEEEANYNSKRIQKNEDRSKN